MTQHEVIWHKYFIFSPHSHVHLHVIGVWSWDGHSQHLRGFLRCSHPATYRYSLPNTGRTYSQTLPQWTCPQHVPQQPWKHHWNQYVEPKHCRKTTEAAQLSQLALAISSTPLTSIIIHSTRHLTALTAIRMATVGADERTGPFRQSPACFKQRPNPGKGSTARWDLYLLEKPLSRIQL